MWVQSQGWEDPLEKEMATHSAILAWENPWTEKPGGLQPVGSQRVGHDWDTELHIHSWTCLFMVQHTQDLIRALETQTFPPNPALIPQGPLCWVTIWRICRRLNNDFGFLMGTHEKHVMLGFCWGLFSPDSCKECENFHIFFPLIVIQEKFGLPTQVSLRNVNHKLALAVGLPSTSIRVKSWAAAADDLQRPEGVQGGEQKWGPLCSSKLAGQVFSS